MFPAVKVQINCLSSCTCAALDVTVASYQVCGCVYMNLLLQLMSESRVQTEAQKGTLVLWVPVEVNDRFLLNRETFLLILNTLFITLRLLLVTLSD